MGSLGNTRRRLSFPQWLVSRLRGPKNREGWLIFHDNKWMWCLNAGPVVQQVLAKGGESTIPVCVCVCVTLLRSLARSSITSFLFQLYKSSSVVELQPTD